MTGWLGAQIVGAVLNGIVEGLLLWTLLWLGLRLVPKTAAATRYALWGLALAFVALLPVVQGTLPRLAAAAPAVAGFEHSGGAVTLTAGTWLAWILGAWGLVSLVLLARVAGGFVALCGLKRRAAAPSAGLAARFEERMRALPGRRRARVLVSSEIVAPVAAGVVRPAVLVPEYLLGELSEGELEQVLTHELAHIRRWDDWTNLAQKLVEALLFFHPAVIWIGRRLTLEREIACDDWVVGLSGTVRPYAACLTRMAALNVATPQLAPGAVARKPQVSIRVEALLDGGRDRKRRFSKAALVTASAALAATAFVAAPLAPVAVALPAIPRPAGPTVRNAPPAMAYAAPRPAAARGPVRTARVRRPRLPVAASKREPAGSVESRDGAMLPVVGQSRLFAAPAVLYYVVYFPDGEAEWIQIVWVSKAPNQALKGT
jgi:beta-lactamase regulating signal transducer with metallopeptidase domain